MPSEIKQCQNCKKTFQVRPEDKTLYEKINVPLPLFCPPCRMMRRLAWRNERTLYRRACDQCSKPIITMYPAGAAFPVYCPPCWWSDAWDGKGYGTIYDPTKSFLDQMKALREKVPRPAVLNMRSINSDYTNMSADNKNCYLIFAAENNEDCYYGRLVQNCKTAVDISWTYDSELCYECLDCRKCYNCLFCERCQTSIDLFFCYDVRNSDHCILSTNLRHKSYYIENRPCSKEEYEKRKQELLRSHTAVEVAKRRLEELKARSLTKYSFQTKCVRTVGDYLYNCHDAYMLFDASNVKDCAYCADAEDPVDCLDGNNIYYKPELCVEVMSALQIYNCRHSMFIFSSNNLEYCDNVHNSFHCFGCVGLKKDNYCILNRQYTKEEYAKITNQILASMQKDGSYGSFPPPAHSLFGYNETLGMDYFPLSKEEALRREFRWTDEIPRTRGQETITSNAIPATIEEVDDGITNEILACEQCSWNFKITPFELSFYRKMHLPLPRKDFECRHQERLRKRTPKYIWHRTCQCAGVTSDQRPVTSFSYQNTAIHHHGQNHCPEEFETSYAPERPEIVYCEGCYQAEVV